MQLSNYGFKILILQHPQEPGIKLGTAKILVDHLQDTKLKVGLSWPNLKKALGTEGDLPFPPSQWGVFYLGSAKITANAGQVLAVDKKGVTRPEQQKILSQIKGLVLLDGTWSQAKTLWWRNAWLLKLTRLVIHPKGPSLYGKYRKEPRKEALSTLETVAQSLSYLSQDQSTELALNQLMKQMLLEK